MKVKDQMFFFYICAFVLVYSFKISKVQIIFYSVFKYFKLKTFVTYFVQYNKKKGAIVFFLTGITFALYS